MSSCQYCPLSQIKFENKQENVLYTHTTKNDHLYINTNRNNKSLNDTISQMPSLQTKDNYLFQYSTYVSSFSKNPIFKKLLESNMSKHTLNKQTNII